MDPKILILLTDRFDRLEKKQDEMSEKQDAMTVQITRNTDSLEVHIAGVKAVNTRVDQVQAELKPLLVREAVLAKLAKWGLGIGTLLGIAYSAIKIFEFFNP